MGKTMNGDRGMTRKAMLTREDEAILVRSAQSGNAQAKDRVIRSFAPMLDSYARKWAFEKGDDFDDARQDAARGLMRAVEKFDPNLGFRLSTYARQWVTETMRIGKHSRDRMIKEPYNQRAAIIRGQVAKAESLLRAQGFGPGDDIRGLAVSKVSEVFGHPATLIDQALTLGANGRVSSLDVPVFDDSGESRVDLIPGNGMSPEEEMILSDAERNRSGIVSQALSRLDRRAARVIRGRFLEDDVMTLEELARELHVSRERIRQIEAKALSDLRNHILRDVGSDVAVMSLSGISESAPRYEKIRGSIPADFIERRTKVAEPEDEESDLEGALS